MNPEGVQQPAAGAHLIRKIKTARGTNARNMLLFVSYEISTHQGTQYVKLSEKFYPILSDQVS